MKNKQHLNVAILGLKRIGDAMCGLSFLHLIIFRA
jgi:hypothetical protein